MALDILKREIPGLDAAADFPASLAMYSLTDHAPIPVATLTEANQKVAEITSEGKLEAFPLNFIVRDSQRLISMLAPGMDWIILGGRLHGAVANIRRGATPGELTEIHVSGLGFIKQSVGFTRHTDGGILIPETGSYRIRMHISLEDIHSSDTGRRLVSLRVNGESVSGNHEFTGGTSPAFYDELEMEQGDSLMPMGYHETDATRSFVGTIAVRQSSEPSWREVAQS